MAIKLLWLKRTHCQNQTYYNAKRNLRDQLKVVDAQIETRFIWSLPVVCGYILVATTEGQPVRVHPAPLCAELLLTEICQLKMHRREVIGFRRGPGVSFLSSW